MRLRSPAPTHTRRPFRRGPSAIRQPPTTGSSSASFGWAQRPGYGWEYVVEQLLNRKTGSQADQLPGAVAGPRLDGRRVGCSEEHTTTCQERVAEYAAAAPRLPKALPGAVTAPPEHTAMPALLPPASAVPPPTSPPGRGVAAAGPQGFCFAILSESVASGAAAGHLPDGYGGLC